MLDFDVQPDIDSLTLQVLEGHQDLLELEHPQRRVGVIVLRISEWKRLQGAALVSMKPSGPDWQCRGDAAGCTP